MNTYDLIDNISKGNLSKAKEMIQGILDKKAVVKYVELHSSEN